jgi:hypothetical protein
MAEKENAGLYRTRFEFLFPAGSHQRRRFIEPRYKLCAPDALELRWNVFDQVDKRTIGYGLTPEDAVDVALDVVERKRIADQMITEQAAREGAQG